MSELKEGVKHDQGKLRFDLIPTDPLGELARVYTIGAAKYEDRNWEKGLKWGRVYAAMMRHARAWWRGEKNDPVDGQHHLGSVAWCAFALMEYENTHPELDDRPHIHPLPTDWSHLAAFFDGEGGVTILKREKRKASYSDGYYLRLELYNTNKEILEHIQSKFGGYMPPVRDRGNPAHSPSYKLVWSHAQVIELLRGMQPWLIVKKERAELALEFQTYLVSLPEVGRNGRKPEEIAVLEQFKHRMNFLNAKPSQRLKIAQEAGAIADRDGADNTPDQVVYNKTEGEKNEICKVCHSPVCNPVGSCMANTTCLGSSDPEPEVVAHYKVRRSHAD